MKKTIISIFIIFMLNSGCPTHKNPYTIYKNNKTHGFLYNNVTKKPISNTIFYFGDIQLETNKDGYFSTSHYSLIDDYINIELFPFALYPINLRFHQIFAPADTLFLNVEYPLFKYHTTLIDLKSTYDIMTVQDYIGGKENLDRKYVVLRHDVDYDSKTALALGLIESWNGISSTYYFRWYTADHSTIEQLRRLGHEIGLHYETLATFCDNNNIIKNSQITDAVIDCCKVLLKNEIELFKMLYGDIQTVSSHGAEANRRLATPNSILLKNEDLAYFGLKGCASLLEWNNDVKVNFIADSGGKWTDLTIEKAVQERRHKLFLLLHPYWWRPRNWPNITILKL